MLTKIKPRNNNEDRSQFFHVIIPSHSHKVPQEARYTPMTIILWLDDSENMMSCPWMGYDPETHL